MIDPATIARYEPLAALVRRCEAGGVPLWIGGNGASHPSVPSGIESLDLRPHAALVAHARDDLTVTVQAGMTIAELQRLLDVAGQALPLDVPFAEQTTVGGLIATSLGGPRRFSRGGVRDWLLGVTIVGRGGEVFRGGGRVVKNVAGYDLCKLFAGSWGWLGAIVEATFRVVPRPEAATAIVLPQPDAAAAEACIAALLAGSLRPASVDLLNRVCAAGLDFPERGEGAFPDGLLLVVGFEGLPAEIEPQVAALIAEVPSAGRTTATLNATQYATARRRCAELVLGMPFAIRLSVRSAAVADLIAQLGRHAPRSPVVAHAADGTLFVGLDADDSAALVKAAQLAAACGGSWLLACRAQATKVELPMLGPPREDWKMMRRIKAALDPGNIFGRDAAFDHALRA